MAAIPARTGSTGTQHALWTTTAAGGIPTNLDVVEMDINGGMYI